MSGREYDQITIEQIEMRNLVFGTFGKKIETTDRPRSKSEEPSSLCFKCSEEVAQSFSGYVLLLSSLAF